MRPHLPWLTIWFPWDSFICNLIFSSFASKYRNLARILHNIKQTFIVVVCQKKKTSFRCITLNKKISIQKQKCEEMTGSSCCILLTFVSSLLLSRKVLRIKSAVNVASKKGIRKPKRFFFLLVYSIYVPIDHWPNRILWWIQLLKQRKICRKIYRIRIMMKWYNFFSAVELS